MILTTERLILRPFTEADRQPYAELNADPEVMRFYPSAYSREQSGTSLDQIIDETSRHGFSFLAAELRETGDFAGLIGLGRLSGIMRAALRGAPEVEIGWRLNKRFWGQGLAPEGARACLEYAWDELALPEVVAFTYRGNLPSQRVMEKTGLARDPDGGFEHPKLAEGHPIRPHVLYRIVNPRGGNRR